MFGVDCSLDVPFFDGIDVRGVKVVVSAVPGSLYLGWFELRSVAAYVFEPSVALVDYYLFCGVVQKVQKTVVVVVLLLESKKIVLLGFGKELRRWVGEVGLIIELLYLLL